MMRHIIFLSLLVSGFTYAQQNNNEQQTPKTPKLLRDLNKESVAIPADSAAAHHDIKIFQPKDSDKYSILNKKPSESTIPIPNSHPIKPKTSEQVLQAPKLNIKK